MSLFVTISNLLAVGRSFVVATVIDMKGSSPRKPGSKMIVLKDGSIQGTIGGGALEKQVIADALALFDTKAATKKTYDLTKELGMCCGGRVEVFFEVVGRNDSLYLFGAGHIAKPLAQIASMAHFDVTVVDERPEFANPERFPTAKEILTLPPEDVFSKLNFGPDVSIAVCTHDHVLDQRIVEKALSKPFRYLGLIGSRTKAAKVRSRLKAQGFTLDQVSRIQSPMGLNVGAQTPEEIAVSIIAEMVAFRHGAIEADTLESFSWDLSKKNVEGATSNG